MALRQNSECRGSDSYQVECSPGRWECMAQFLMKLNSIFVYLCLRNYVFSPSAVFPSQDGAQWHNGTISKCVFVFVYLCICVLRICVFLWRSRLVSSGVLPSRDGPWWHNLHRNEATKAQFWFWIRSTIGKGVVE